MVPQLAEQLAKCFPLTDIETRQHRLNLPIVNPKRLLHQLAAARRQPNFFRPHVRR